MPTKIGLKHHTGTFASDVSQGEGEKGRGMVRDGAHALVVRIHVPAILSAVGLDARVDADAGAGQHCCATRREEGGDALDSF